MFICVYLWKKQHFVHERNAAMIVPNNLIALPPSMEVAVAYYALQAAEQLLTMATATILPTVTVASR